MNTVKQGEIWFANLNPTKGSEQAGIRPVVVISGNAMNEHSGIVIVCPLTSKIKNYSGCIILKKDKNNNLSQDSEVIVFQIRTLSKDRLTKKTGKVLPDQLQDIVFGLNEVLRY